MDDLTLATCPGLPDALRVLVERYPREVWETHLAFDQLTRFWLDRHLMFRAAQARLIGDTQGFLDRARDPRRFAAELDRLAGFFVGAAPASEYGEDVPRDTTGARTGSKILSLWLTAYELPIKSMICRFAQA